MSRTSNEPAAPNATSFLNNFKYEVANELGINNYQTVDKGQLTSRENGYVGGYMVKKMIQYAEQNMPSGSSMTMGIRETTGITEKTEIIAKTATTETEIIIETIALIKIKSIEAIIKDKIKNIIRTAARITEIMGIMVPEKIGMITAKTAVSVKIIRNLPATAEWV